MITANENFLRAIGYGLDEIKGKNHSLFVDEATRRGSEYKDFWAKLNRGEFQSGEFKRVAKGGREVWVQASYYPVPDSQGRLLKVVACASDVTKQHELSEEMTELRVRANITNLTSIVSEADLKGDILTVNEKFIEVSKYSRDELLGKPHNTTRHPDMPKETFKELWSTIGRGKMFRGIIKNRAKDGTPYYVDAVIAPVLGEDGKPKKYIGVRYDITVAEIQRREMQGVIDAINATYCYVEYDTAGSVLKANNNFLKLFGYRSEEVAGKHQRTFVEAGYSNSQSYTQFWNELNGGKTYNDVYKRVAKDGRELWIQGVYAPVKDEMGRVVKFIEIGTDVTSQKLAAADAAGQIAAIGKAQAVIAFQMDGTVIDANENFLRAMGYTLDEIKGKHHSLFVDEAQRHGSEYKEFWANLNRGIYQTGEFKRIGKGGKEVWLQAAYNPILDLNGKPFKVVKYASDITPQKNAAEDLRRKVDSILGVVSAASKGDLTQEITVSGTDAIGQMGTGLSQLFGNLRASIGRIGQTGREPYQHRLGELTSVSQQMKARPPRKPPAQAWRGVAPLFLKK